MASNTVKTLRNLVHPIAGFVVAYKCVEKLSIKDFPEWEYYGFSIFCGLFIGLAIGFLWEGMMKMIFKEQDDVKDIWRTMYGGVFGGIIAMLFKDIWFINNIMFFGIVLGAILDIIRAKRQMKN